MNFYLYQWAQKHAHAISSCNTCRALVAHEWHDNLAKDAPLGSRYPLVYQDASSDGFLLDWLRLQSTRSSQACLWYLEHGELKRAEVQNEYLQSFSESISSRSGVRTMKGCEIRSCYSSLLHTPLASIYELLYVTVRLYSILLIRSTEVFMIMVGRGWTDILEGHSTKYGIFPSSTSHEV